MLVGVNESSLQRMYSNVPITFLATYIYRVATYIHRVATYMQRVATYMQHDIYIYTAWWDITTSIDRDLGSVEAGSSARVRSLQILDFGNVGAGSSASRQCQR